MRRRRVKRVSEEVIKEMLELYTMRPPFRIRKGRKAEPDKSESEKKNTREDREDKKPC